ncbi:MAG: signal recognition particle protein, partial [Bacteroidales bacterium]|nr:signal recognition particle protein [Bacteroidales bacterium]
SMTKEERENPSLLNGSRRRRIAEGSGTSIAEINRLVKQFEDTRKMMKNMAGGGAAKAMRAMGSMRKR